MGNMNNNVIDFIFNREAIYLRAKERWDKKTTNERLKAEKKYKHIMVLKSYNDIDWNRNFDKLLNFQKFLLYKGEIIRTYNNLKNIEKTYIKRTYNLDEFQTKWHKLSHNDKMKILNVLNAKSF